MPLKRQKSIGVDSEEQLESGNTALDYLSSLRNLNAQEGVWKASRVIAILGLLQTITGMFGLVGLWLVYRTLGEAKKTTRQAISATNAANKTANAAENAERAHVYIEWVPKLSPDHGSSCVEIFFRLRNYGATPARKIEFAVMADVAYQSQTTPVKYDITSLRTFALTYNIAIELGGPSIPTYFEKDEILVLGAGKK